MIEVACGVLFGPLQNLLVPHFGLLWERFGDEFNQCLEVPPLTAAIENFEEVGGQRVRLEFGSLPPLPRIWFQHKSGGGLIQLQRDRFHYNWRKLGPSDEYPHFNSVFNSFVKHFEQLESFLRERNLADVRPIQYEMTYINHIEHSGAFFGLDRAGETFPDFMWRNDEKRFLPALEAINWQSIFPLPDKLGRLHVTMNNAIRASDRMPILNLEITARGVPRELPREQLSQWFELAHQWIVRGFTDLTSEAAHKIWRRTK